MIKKIILSFYFLLILISIGRSQEIHKISGHITNLNDTIAVAYAHIGILGTGIGTVSNINGDFQLKGYFNLEKDSLVISHIEYENRSIPFKSLLADTNHIELIKNDYELGEVIVLPNEKKKEIFKNVIKNLKKNYSEKLYQSEAFFREVKYDEKTKTYSRLIEAAINIQDGKITAPISKIKCSILQFRKSDNFTNEHWGVKTFLKLLNLPMSNNLQVLLKGNPVRSYNATKHTIFDNEIKTLFEKNLDDLNLVRKIRKNNDDIYVFKHIYSDCEATFYVQKSNYAILQCDYKMGTKPILKNTYHFKKIGEKYYPAFFSISGVETILADNQGLEMKNISLTFIDYHFDKKTFKRVRRKHVLPKDVDLYDQEVEYNEAFWANYNILLEEPLDDKVISDLEREENLTTQFKKNAKTKL